jgi:3-oxoacyl-[acyl-carrier-protein] synthase II
MLYGFGRHVLSDSFAPVWERRARAMASPAQRSWCSKRASMRCAWRETAGTASRAVGSQQPQGDATKTTPWCGPRRTATLVRSHRRDLGRVGEPSLTSVERALLAAVPDSGARPKCGHAFEPQFPMNIALATVALGHQKLFSPGDSSGVEREMAGSVEQIVVTSVGHWRGEGMALVAAVR